MVLNNTDPLKYLKSSYDLAYPRVDAARKNVSFKFPVANKAESASVFGRKLISFDDAVKLYGIDRKIAKQEAVSGGGAATRFLNGLRAINSVFCDDDSMILDEALFKKLQENKTYNDVKGLMNQKEVLNMIHSPMARFLGIRESDFPKDEAGHYYLKPLQQAFSQILDQFAGILKGFTYGFEVNLDGQSQPIYINFFLNKYIQTLMDLKDQGIKGNTMYVQLDNQANIAAFQKIVDALKAINVVDPSILDVKFSGERQAPVVSLKTGYMLTEDQKLKTQPTGHGPVVIYVTNTVLADQKRPVPFTLQNMDNIAVDLAKYSSVTHNGTEFEDQLRHELIGILQKNNFNAFVMMLFNPKWGIKNLDRYDFRKPLTELAAQFIEERWDYKVNPQKDIITQIKDLPITIAVVAEVDKIKPGGGLFLHRDTKQMCIVEEPNIELTPEQRKNNDFITYFNPVLFSILAKKPMSGDMETNAIFLTTKGTTEKFRKGESASTHLATDYNTVLKRVITVPSAKIASVIVENKFITSSAVTVPENQITAQKLADQIKRIAQEKGLDLVYLGQKLMEAQEMGRMAAKGKI